MEAETALLGHRATILWLRCLHLLSNPLPGRAATTHLHNRLTGIAGRGLAANVIVAIAHDCDPLLMSGHNAQAPSRLPVTL